MRSLVQFSPARAAATVAFVLCILFSGAQTASGQAAVNQYRFTTANGTAIVPGTTQITNFNCGFTSPGDDCVATIALPFTYRFYGNNYNSTTISSNGNIQFESTNPDYGQNEVCFPLTQFNHVIAAHFSDLTIGSAGEGVFTSTTGVAPNRVFNIEWRASNIGQAVGSLNFEIRLYEGQTRFDIVYGAVPGNGLNATVGAQRSNALGAGAFTQYECRSGGLRNGLRIRGEGLVATSYSIAGQATDTDGNPLPGVTVTLSGDLSATTMTDANGQYLFEGLNLNGHYTVAASDGNSTFFPASRDFPMFPGNQTVNFIRTILPTTGQVLISEFRFRGPIGANDEFVEIYNNTNSTFVVNTTDGTAGWSVFAPPVASAPPVGFVIPNGTTLPPRTHYLAGNTSGYNLTAFASPDAFFGSDFADNTGIALIAGGVRLDAVGFTGSDPSVREGNGIPAISSDNGQYSFLRKLMTTGTPQDTDDNANDFQMVSTNAASFGAIQSVLGAPGPENQASHIQRNATVKAQLVDPQCGGLGAPTSACARVRTGANANPSNAAFGTLLIRRKFTNTTGQRITRLRFRIVDLSTKGNEQSNQADLRAISSADVSVTNSNNQSVPLRGLTLGQSDVQPEGGGINSTLFAPSVTLSTPLAPNAAINVEFRLGVMVNGNFRFFINVEAITGGILPPPEEGLVEESLQTKRAGSQKTGSSSSSSRRAAR